MEASCPIRPTYHGTSHPDDRPADLPLHQAQAAFVPFVVPRPEVESTLAGYLAFVLFLLLNAALFIRPAEIVPHLLAWPIYEALIVACLVLSLPVVLRHLSLYSFVQQPITACVVGLVVAVVLSHLSYASIWHARMSGWDFSKVIIYYLLLIAAIDSPWRLRRFLLWLVAMSFVVTVLAVLQYHGAIDIAALAALEQVYEDRSGHTIVLRRLVSTGIFNDPNDLCLLLVLAIVLCLHELLERGPGFLRFLWLGPLGLFAYALVLTHSRGGLISLLAALAVLVAARFRSLTATLLATLVVSVLIFASSGRQTELSLDSDTGQARIQIWSDGLVLLRGAPIFGIGYGNFDDEVSHVAHNSFLHCFVELGFFGGTLFFSAFAFALFSLYQLGAKDRRSCDGQMHSLRPYMMALTAGYAAGMMSLSRAYVVPTYLVLGLIVAYTRIVSADHGGSSVCLSVRSVSWMVLLSTALVLAIRAFVFLFVRWG